MRRPFNPRGKRPLYILSVLNVCCAYLLCSCSEHMNETGESAAVDKGNSCVDVATPAGRFKRQRKASAPLHNTGR